MLGYNNYNPTEEDIDKVKLAIVKLLFDNGLKLDSANFVNCKDGTQEIKITLTPRLQEDVE